MIPLVSALARAVGSCALCVITAVSVASCGSAGSAGGASATLQAAADATAKAHSFVLTVAGADVTYEAPDRVQQIEHGEASTATAANGSESSSGPFPQTITKVFIGDRYYEAQTRDGETPAFTSAQRCPTPQNAAEAVLRLLRAIVMTTDVQRAGDTYTFRLRQSDDGSPTTGTATVENGFVRTLSFPPSTETVTIGSVNSGLAVTAPALSTAVNLSCGS
jgi:hypothetical protein